MTKANPAMPERSRDEPDYDVHSLVLPKNASSISLAVRNSYTKLFGREMNPPHSNYARCDHGIVQVRGAILRFAQSSPKRGNGLARHTMRGLLERIQNTLQGHQIRIPPFAQRPYRLLKHVRNTLPRLDTYEFPEYLSAAECAREGDVHVLRRVREPDLRQSCGASRTSVSNDARQQAQAKA
ncbi:MAG TPA: hypothetical protein VHQ95_04755 [Pyrinomonadaceae bacterium]|nr:hypothetical protein [Pyrinomonadaceae bacterium]